MNPPVIFEHIEAQTYLEAYYKYRKTVQKNFSYEFWARELNINSRSFLRMLISGKRKISPKFVRAFSKHVLKESAEVAYFDLLVGHALAKTVKERHSYSEKMIHMIKYQMNARVIDGNQDFISDPLLPRLLALIGFKDVRASSGYCARLLKIDIQEAEKALKKLEAMNLVERVSSGEETVWIALSDVFHVPDGFGSLDLLKFHQKSLQDALAAFTQDKKLRKYKSMFLPLSEADLHEFNQMQDAFIDSVLRRFNSKSYKGKRMFQANFNFHAISEEEFFPLEEKIDI